MNPADAPLWMREQHWILFSAFFWGLTTFALLIARSYLSARFVAILVASFSLAIISTCFYLAAKRPFGISTVWFFAVERAFWYPLGFSLYVLLDAYMLERWHKSPLSSFYKRFAREKEQSEP